MGVKCNRHTREEPAPVQMGTGIRATLRHTREEPAPVQTGAGIQGWGEGLLAPDYVPTSTPFLWVPTECAIRLTAPVKWPHSRSRQSRRSLPRAVMW